MTEIRQQTELSWAAGFFDGDGCTSTLKARTRRSVEIQIGQTDTRPLVRFRDAVGEGNLHGPYVSSSTDGYDRQPTYFYRLVGAGAVRVLSRLWPYLSEPKREQAMAALADANETRDGLQLYEVSVL